MTSRQFALEVPIEGKDEISRVLQQAQRLVKTTTQQMEHELRQVENALEATGDAAEQAGQQIRRSLGQGLQQAGQAARNAGQQISQAGQALTSGLTIPIAAIGIGMAKLNDAAESLQVAESFRRLAQEAGLSAEQVVAAMDSMAGGAISQRDLMLSANRALVLGVAQNTDDFRTLMAVSRQAARDMGLSTQQAFDDLVTGIGRASPEILDNLGINIRAAEATEAYARQIGKAANELTAAERTQALMNAVLAQSGDAVATMANATRTQAEEYQQMRAELQDTTDELLRSLLPVMQQTLGLFNAMPGPLKTATIAMIGLGLAAGPVAQALGALTSAAGLAVQGIGFLMDAEKRAILVNRLMAISLRGVLISSGIGLAIVALTLLWQHWDTIWPAIQRITQRAVAFIQEHWDKLLIFLGPAGALLYALKTLAGGWGELWQKIKDVTAAAVNPIIGVINALLDAMDRIPGVSIGNVPRLGAAGGGAGVPAGGSRTTIVNVNGPVVREDGDIESLAHRVRGATEGAR